MPTVPQSPVSVNGVIASDANLVTSDITTNDVSATKHGFAPKFPNNTTTFLRGDGTYAAPAGGSPMTLLAGSNGTSTTTTANNLATVAISGLTILDTLQVMVTMDATTQAGGDFYLYSTTDSVQIVKFMAGGGGSLAAGNDYRGTAFIGQNSRTNATIVSNVVEAISTQASGGGTAGILTRYETLPVTTAWTGSWTMALRSGGVTSGGSLAWTWTVYKIAGQ